jgi:hypothetical protein
MECLNYEERLERRRQWANYKKEYRLTHPYYEAKQKNKPEYQEREKLRKKRSYERIKIFNVLPKYTEF